MIRTGTIAVASLVLLYTSALAEKGAKPSDGEITRIGSAISQVGCEGGEYIKEPSGLFEIDDAKCRVGQYDIKLDKDFTITLMSRD